jgi:hypothetical protein
MRASRVNKKYYVKDRVCKCCTVYICMFGGWVQQIRVAWISGCHQCCLWVRLRMLELLEVELEEEGRG